MKSACPIKTFQMDMTLDSRTFHGFHFKHMVLRRNIIPTMPHHVIWKNLKCWAKTFNVSQHFVNFMQMILHNATTCNMKESQALGKNIQCVTTYSKFHVDDSTAATTLDILIQIFWTARRRSRAIDSCCQIDLSFLFKREFWFEVGCFACKIFHVSVKCWMHV